MLFSIVAASFTFPTTVHEGSLKKLKVELPYDPAIPLQGIYPENALICEDSCSPMLIAALFTIARMWKKPKCPSTDQ